MASPAASAAVAPSAACIAPSRPRVSRAARVSRVEGSARVVVPRAHRAEEGAVPADVAASLSRRDAVFVGAGLAAFPALPALAAEPLKASFYDYTVSQYGEPFDLGAFRGNVTVVLNVASEWPLQNANYPGLRKLREKYGKDGFELVAFPANQFGCQAPGTSEMERAYAWRKFGFEFPVMDKIAVKDKPAKCKGVDPASYEEFKDDPDAMLTAPLVDDKTSSAPIAPVYAFLKQPPFDGEIPWNYTKFLIGRDGKVLRRYSPADPLEQGMEEDVKRALAGEKLRERPRGIGG